MGRRALIAEVRLWGRRIGAVAQTRGRDVAAFEYDRDFAASGVEPSPLTMPVREGVYEFPELPRASFHGLPGLLADALPDRFGNALIDGWLAVQGRAAEDFGAVERLCYTGSRGMGALEFAPAFGPSATRAAKIEVDALVRLASDVLSRRGALKGRLRGAAGEKALREILLVGTSAGGARAKAVVAWNRATNEVRSGRVPADEGFEHWLIKFDGVEGNQDKEIEDPKGYGAIEYAYHLMAREAGVVMTECRLLEENGRRHFMTRRFDRPTGGGKLHLQSLAALAHFDFNQAGVYAYEQATATIRRLGLPTAAVEQQFRRAAFNVVARNQDDHVKNIAFLMDKEGRWSLAPAYDVTFAYNPKGALTGAHKMTLNGKRDDFVRADFDAFAKSSSMKRGRAAAILDEVRAAVARWPAFARAAAVESATARAVGKAHRLKLPAR